MPRPAAALLPVANASGEALYLRECAPCHGPAGHGDGPEAPTFRNAPRDLGDLARAEPSARIVDRVRRSRLRMLAIDDTVVAERRKRMVEELVGHMQRMPDVPWPLVRRGADVYAERCETCHGPNGRPVAVTVLQRGAQPVGPQPPPDFQKAHGDAALIRIARGDGHRAMPGFTPVRGEEDAGALLAYLRVLSNGFAWYSLWCAGCHGDEGRGDGPLATGIDQPRVVFDRAYLSAQSPADLRRKAMHVFTEDEPATPHFQRDVSQGQARAVLAAVRALQAAEAATPPAVVPTPVAPGLAPSSGDTPSASRAPIAVASPVPSASRTSAPSRAVAKPAKPKTAAVKKAPPGKTSVKSKPKPRPTAKKQKAKPAATKKAPPRATPTPDLIEAP